MIAIFLQKENYKLLQIILKTGNYIDQNWRV